MQRLLTFTSPPARCEYLPDQICRIRYEVDPNLTPADYQLRLQSGWRRFGPAMFRPECPSCTSCQSLRVPSATYRPNASQKRAWRRNAEDVSILIGTPSVTAEKVELFDRFHQFGHEVKGWPAKEETDLELFTENPFAVEEWSYYVGDRLIGLGYVDALAGGLSAIYFAWDPDERRRSLGTFNILAIIESARDRELPYVYLGYYVEGCRSLEYKARFMPNEVLSAGRGWTRR